MIYANHIIINDFCLCLGGKEALLSYRKFHLRHIRSSVVIIFLVTYRPVLLITTLDAHYPRLLHEITSSIYQRIPVQCLIFSNSIFVLLTIYTQALTTPHHRFVQSPSSKSVNSWMFLYTAMAGHGIQNHLLVPSPPPSSSLIH